MIELIAAAARTGVIRRRKQAALAHPRGFCLLQKDNDGFARGDGKPYLGFNRTGAPWAAQRDCVATPAACGHLGEERRGREVAQ